MKPACKSSSVTFLEWYSGACDGYESCRYHLCPPTFRRAVVVARARGESEAERPMKLARHLLTTSQKPGVCLVVGAGAGIGAHVARRFALSGLTAVLCRRTNQEGLDAAVRAIEDEGGRAKGYLLNVVTPGSIEAIVEEVEASLGAIEVCPAHAHMLQPALPPCIPLLPRLQPLVLLDERFVSTIYYPRVRRWLSTTWARR